MNHWKKPVSVLGAAVLCASFLMADTPPGQITRTVNQLAPAEVGLSQITALDVVEWQQFKKPPGVSSKASAVAGNMTAAVPDAGALRDDGPCRADCPPFSIFSQRPVLPHEAWRFGASEANADGDIFLRAENFSVDRDIYGIHWWGAWLRIDLPYLAWEQCDESDPTFEIKFYKDAGGAPGAEVCSYTVVPEQMMTGLLYAAGTYEMVHFSVDLLSAPCVISDGWVSIQGFGDSGCWFMWAASPIGDGSHYFTDDGVYMEYLSRYDLSVCLIGESVPRWGACCDDYTGICEDNVEDSDCDGRFAEGGSVNSCVN